MEKKEMISKFDSLVGSVIKLIEQDKFDEAREIFNRDIFSEFKKIVWDSKSPLNKFVFFFCQLDEYLNNEVARSSGVVSKESVLSEYYEDYKSNKGK